MSKKNAKTQANEFDETLAASKSFFEKNKKAILWGGGGLLAIIIIALLVHQGTRLLQLFYQIIATRTMRFTVGHTGTKRHLTGHIPISAVSIKHRHVHHRRSATLGLRSRLAA